MTEWTNLKQHGYQSRIQFWASEYDSKSSLVGDRELIFEETSLKNSTTE